MRNEIRPLTGLRGVAALVVALYHCTLQTTMPVPYTPRFIHHGYLAVDLFFVLSGFVLALTYGRLFRESVSARAVAGFLFRRFARIYPAYIAITAFVLLRYGQPNSRPYDAHDLVANLFLVQAWGFGFRSILGNAWSVSTELFAYLAFPWIILSVARARVIKPLLLLLAIGGIVSVFRFGAGVTGPLDVTGENSPFAVMRCCSGFVLGILAFELTAKDRIMRIISGKMANNIALSAIGTAIALGPNDLISFFCFPALVLVLYVDRGWAKALFDNRPIYYIGMVSYSFYLVYPLAQGYVRPHVAALSYNLIALNTLGIGATIMLACLFATISYYVIECPGRLALNSALRWRKAPVANPA
jgi:peptidoglycan/LPS O-acetylase OafA/YrhL